MSYSFHIRLTKFTAAAGLPIPWYLATCREGAKRPRADNLAGDPSTPVGVSPTGSGESPEPPIFQTGLDLTDNTCPPSLSTAVQLPLPERFITFAPA